MDQLAAAVYAEETGRSLLALAVEMENLEAEITASAYVQWESAAADAFRHGLADTVRGLPGASSALRAAAGELQQDPLLMAAGS